MSEKRLLVVDDEPEFGELVARVAADLQSAYHELHPTLVVLDMVMPEMDGNELVLWLMEQHYAADLIIITGYSPEYAKDAQLLAEFKGLHSVTTLAKPIRLAKLREALGG